MKVPNRLALTCGNSGAGRRTETASPRSRPRSRSRATAPAAPGRLGPPAGTRPVWPDRRALPRSCTGRTECGSASPGAAGRPRPQTPESSSGKTRGNPDTPSACCRSTVSRKLSSVLDAEKEREGGRRERRRKRQREEGVQTRFCSPGTHKIYNGSPVLVHSVPSCGARVGPKRKTTGEHPVRAVRQLGWDVSLETFRPSSALT